MFIAKIAPPLPAGQFDYGLFIAIKENVPFTLSRIQPKTGQRGTKLRIKVTGTGFQPGATISFRGNSIITLDTKFDPLTASTTFFVTLDVSSTTKPGFHDVFLTNPTGDELILKNGFSVKK